MIEKLLISGGSFLAGALVVGVGCRKIITHQRDCINAQNVQLEEVDTLREEINDKTVEYIRSSHMNNLYRTALTCMGKISDVDMIADISVMDSARLDACLNAIKNTTLDIAECINVCVSTSVLTEKEANKYRDRIIGSTSITCDLIHDVIREYESIEDDDDNYDDEDVDDDSDDDDEVIGVKMSIDPDDDCEDDDDDDDDLVYIYPKAIVPNCVNGHAKQYDVDEEGIGIFIDFSDISNNVYCTKAEYIPELCNDLKQSVKEQCSGHIINQINPDIFDALIEDSDITLYLAYLDDSEDVMTILNWRIDLEMGVHSIKLDSGDTKIYNVIDGRVNDDSVKNYFKCQSDDNGGDDSSKDDDTNADYTDMNIDDSIQFIIENVGYNRESLKCFIDKLGILYTVNYEAWEAICTAYSEIIRDIHKFKKSGKLTDETSTLICNRIKALKENMTRNYGGAIRLYRQKLKSQSDT